MKNNNHTLSIFRKIGVAFLGIGTLIVVLGFSTKAEAATTIYRSVAASSTAALSTTTVSNITLSISGATATFSGAQPANMGVGDAIQYDSDNNGSIDSIAFVHDRISSTVYTVKNAAGANSTSTSAADTDWGVFRAYTSLSSAETGIENTAINDTVENFDTWSGGKALTTTDEQWNLVMYSNGIADNVPTTIDGWTTDATRYLRVYTPTATTEVGTSQRHAGVWDNNKYYLTASSSTVLSLQDNFIRIQGLQIWGALTSGSQTVVGWATGGNDVIFSNNIVKKPTGGTGNVGVSLTGSGANQYVYNNIIYDIAGSNGVGISDSSGSGTFAYIFNNTIANITGTTGRGIDAKTFGRFTIKNNLIFNVTNAATGTAAAASNYNSTNNGSMGYTVTGGGNVNDRTNQIFSFTSTSTKDFHLLSGDVGARDFGVDLSADTNLPFSIDIDSEPRGAGSGWDIGADEYQAPDVVSPVRSNGSPTGVLVFGTTQVTLQLNTDEVATCKYGTVASTAYASIVNTFSGTGGILHTQNITGLTNGGSYTYYVRCQDVATNTNTDDYVISFSVQAGDVTPPTISITSPSNGAVVGGGTVTLTATSSDNDTVAGVQFKLDGITNIGSEDTTSTYSVSWDTSAVAEGAHTIIAVARDSSGNYATSSVINVTVNNVVPVVTLLTPVTGTSVRGNTMFTYTVTGTTSPQCSIGGTRWITCPPSGETFFSQLPGWGSLVASSTFTLYVRDTSPAGVTSTSTIAGLIKRPYTNPVGIPTPSFGLTQTVASVYGDANYYTYWIDNTHPSATDSGNASGTPSVPRMTIPNSLILKPGDVVQLRGGPYSTVSDRFSVFANGTSGAPIFITGLEATTTPILQKWIHFKEAQYMIFEGVKIQPNGILGGLEFRPMANGVEIHHNAVRYIQTQGVSTTTTNTTAGQSMSTGNTTYDTDIHDILFYENVSRDSGNWMSATEDDQHTFAVGSKVKNAWYLDNVGIHSSGDGIQVSHNGNYTSDHIYIGRNLFFEHRENGVDLKQANDVIVSENIMHTFRDTASSAGTAAVVHFNPQRIWFLNNTIYDAQTGITSTGVSSSYSVIGNVIYDIKIYPGVIESHASTSVHRLGSGIYWYSTATTTVANNTIYNTGTGISADLGSSGAFIENNIVSNLNTAFSDYHLNLTGSTGISKSTFRNNLFYQPGAAVQIISGSATCVSCLETDPLFTNPSSADFTLQSGSPAKNSGVAQAFAEFQSLYGIDLSKDINSTARPQGGVWDMGAYEFIEAGDTTAPVISSVASSTLATTTTITWTTNENSTSTVRYGLNSSYGFASTSASSVTSHTITLTGLATSTTYHFQVSSTDSSGNTATSSDYIFTTLSGADVTPPTISLVASTTDQTSATITWTTDEAADSQVDYGADASYGSQTSLNPSFVTSHSTVVSGLTAGTTYHFRVLSRDFSGNLATSTDYTFTTDSLPADTTPPTVSLEVPLNNAVVSGSVSVQAAASDDIAVAGVRFYADNVLIGAEDTTSTYEVTWDTTGVVDGLHTLLAVARDTSDNVATSTSKIVTVDNTAPVRSSGSPTGTLSFGTTATTISLATNEDSACKYSTSSGVAYASMTLFGTTGGTTHSASISGLSNGGSYIYYVKCSDNQSNINATDYTISFVVAASADVPVVSITSPLNSETVSGSAVNILADATDDVAVQGVQFILDGNVLIGAQDTTSPYGVTWDSTAVTDGNHTLIAVAQDYDSNVATSSIITITVDNTAPVRSGAAPSGTLSIGTTGTTISLATDENATCKYSTTAGTAYGSMSLFVTTGGLIHSTSITGLTDGGSYTYYIKCSDTSGNVGVSDYPISFSVAVSAPVVNTSTPVGPTGGGGSSGMSSVQPVQNQQPPVVPQTVPNGVIGSGLVIKNISSQGKTSAEIKIIQRLLNSDPATMVAKTGVGSPGKETNYFGPATRAAVQKFQSKYGIVKNSKDPGYGVVGPKTRAKMNELLKRK